MNGENELLTNGLMISVDWLSWTFKDDMTVEDVVRFMGFDSASFHLLPKGANGYRSQLRHTALPVSILYDGGDDMGIHVDVSGSAIGELVKHYQRANMVVTPFGTSAYVTSSFDYTVFTDMLDKILRAGQVTRLDLAIDDMGANYFSLDDLHGIFSQKHYVSKFRSWREIIEYDNQSYKTGHTIYLGSRTSAIMLRIYDKQLEQINKNPELAFALPHWVRWEIELKAERALLASQTMISGIPLGGVAVGVLSHYLRIICPDNARIDRSTVSPKWMDFINGISGISLYNPAKPKTVEDKRHWLMKQVSNTLAIVVSADGGDIDIVHRMLDSGRSRLTEYQEELIEQAQREEMLL